VTIKNGRVQQSNFDTFPIPRMPEVPPIEVVLMPNDEVPGGIREAGVPLVAPAMANAVFALTGKRISRCRSRTPASGSSDPIDRYESHFRRSWTAAVWHLCAMAVMPNRVGICASSRHR
jgi:hypothetical protein